MALSPSPVSLKRKLYDAVGDVGASNVRVKKQFSLNRGANASVYRLRLGRRLTLQETILNVDNEL